MPLSLPVKLSGPNLTEKLRTDGIRTQPSGLSSFRRLGFATFSQTISNWHQRNGSLASWLRGSSCLFTLGTVLFLPSEDSRLGSSTPPKPLERKAEERSRFHASLAEAAGRAATRTRVALHSIDGLLGVISPYKRFPIWPTEGPGADSSPSQTCQWCRVQDSLAEFRIHWHGSYTRPHGTKSWKQRRFVKKKKIQKCSS